MATKEKQTKKSRDHKESKGSARGARKTRLTELQKILMVSGGMAHGRLRSGVKYDGSGRRAKISSGKLD